MLSAKQVEPGKSGDIEVSVTPQGVTSLSKSVSVTTNDPRQQVVTLTVTATVRPEFALSERSIYFGTVPKGQEVVRELVITLPSEKPVSILSAQSTDQSVSVRLEPVSDSHGKKVKLIAAQRADAKEGYHFGTILIKTTSALTPELRIPVRGTVAANTQPN